MGEFTSEVSGRVLCVGAHSRGGTSPQGRLRLQTGGAGLWGDSWERCLCSDRVRMPKCSRASEETESRGSVVGGSWCWTRLLGQLRPRASEFQGACVDSHEHLLCLQVPGARGPPVGKPLGSAPFTVLGPAGRALPRAGSSVVLWTTTWTLGDRGHSLNPQVIFTCRPVMPEAM